MRFHSSFLLSLTLTISSLSIVRIAPAGSATWKANPTSGDWNTAANWTPATVPNGESDSASFAVSSKTAISLSAAVEANTIAFETSANSFTVTAPSQILSLSGVGVINNSAVMQNLATGSGGEIDFTNSATAGTGVSLVNSGAATQTSLGGRTKFFDTSSAGAAVITNNAGSGFFSDGGATSFADFSSAGDAVFFNKTGTSVYSGTMTFAGDATAANASVTSDGGTSSSLSYAMVTFSDRASAGNATFANGGAIGELGYPAFLEFYGSATAGTATITNDGSQGDNASGGRVDFYDNTSAGNSTITLTGGLVFAGAGGTLSLNGASTAANSTLIANDAGHRYADGGHIWFLDDSIGGSARVKVFGMGTLDVGYHNAPGVTIGSLEGDGIVFLGSNELTVGGDNQDASFSGLIKDGRAATGGALIKTGTGKLTLSSHNSYTGGTTVVDGTLLIGNRAGSATGPGEVHVNAGTLGGTGKIEGAVTLGTGTGAGAFLSPGKSPSKPGRLTVKGTVTFTADSTYQCALDRVRMKPTQVTAAGVTIDGAQFVFADLGNGSVTSGEVFIVINNTSASPINGTFANLGDGSTFTSSGGTTFLVSYEGGTGNDLTLTVQ